MQDADVIFSLFIPFTSENPNNITLSIVRDQGSSMDVLVYYTTKAALHLPPINQASEGTDYVAKESTVVMMENATVVLVSITILPVSTTTSVGYHIITNTSNILK